MIVHYKPNPTNATGWSVWTWSDQFEGKDVKFTGKDDFGLVAKLTVKDFVTQFGFIIRTEDWQKDIADNRFAVPNAKGVAEIWLVSGNPTVFEKEPTSTELNKKVEMRTNIKVHYKSNPLDSKGWMIWAWGEKGDGKSFNFTGQDEYGLIANVEFVSEEGKVGFVTYKEGWIKDVSTDRFILPDQKGNAEVWLVYGDPTVYTKQPNMATVKAAEEKKYPVDFTIHYQRPDGFYTNWSAYTYFEDARSKHCTFDAKDAFGAISNCKVERGKGKIGFVIKDDRDPKNWIKDIPFDRFTDVKNDKAEIWLISGDETVYLKPPTQADRDAAFEKVLSTSPTHLKVHYARDDGKYDPWKMWSWAKKQDGGLFAFRTMEPFGMLGHIVFPKKYDAVGLVIKMDNPKTNQWIKDGDKDRLIPLKNGKGEIWIYQGDSNVYVKPPLSDLTVKLHYNRPKGDYTGWSVWYGTSKTDRRKAAVTGKDEYGQIMELKLYRWKSERMLFWIEQDGKQAGKPLAVDGAVRTTPILKSGGNYEYWIRQADARLHLAQPAPKK